MRYSLAVHVFRLTDSPKQQKADLMDPTPSLSDHPNVTVCVTNLPSETSEADLRELFSAYGAIQEIKLYPAQAYRSQQGQGYLDLSPSAVERAVAAVDGHLFRGAVIRVSQVPHGTLLPQAAEERPTGVVGSSDDEVPSVRMANQFEVATVEKAASPDGCEGEDWFRYVLTSGRSQIMGLHRGTLDEVMEYAAGCAEQVNSRRAIGKSARTYAPSKKK
jgi:RNA recognition motif-containing protein